MEAWLDYWALANVVPESCRIRYRGIDTIDWAYQISARNQDDMKFICHDAIDCLFKAKTLSADVYIFPKVYKRVPRQCDATHWTDFWRKNACREHCFLPVFFAN